MQSYLEVTSGFEQTQECIEWTGTLNHRGTPVMYVDGHHELVHRLVYRLYVGPLKDGSRIKQSCKNKRCLSPQHLLQAGKGDDGKHYKYGLTAAGNPRYRDVIREHDGYVVQMTRPSYRKAGFVTALEAFAHAQNIRNNGGVNDEILAEAKLQEGVLVISEVKDYTDQSADKTTCWIWDGTQTVNATDPRSGKDYSTSPARAMWHCLVGVIPLDKRLRSVCKKDGCVRPSHRQPAAATPWGRNAQVRETYDFLSEEDFDSIHKYDREYDFNFSHQMRRANV